MALTFSATTLRNDAYIGLSRLLQVILAIVVLGLVGSGLPSWSSAVGCYTPPSMNFMVACGVLTLLYVVYLAVSTWSSRTTFLWNPYVQLGLDGLFLIFWIAACAVAKPTCTQFENACAAWMTTAFGWRTWNDLEIDCFGLDNCRCYTTSGSSTTVKRGFSSSSSSEVRSGVKLVGKLAESQGVGAALVLLFAFTLAFGLYRFFQDKHAVKASSTSGQNEPLSPENENKEPQATTQEVPP